MIPIFGNICTCISRQVGIEKLDFLSSKMVHNLMQPCVYLTKLSTPVSFSAAEQNVMKDDAIFAKKKGSVDDQAQASR